MVHNTHNSLGYQRLWYQDSLVPQQLREELTDEGDVEGEAAAQHYDSSLWVPIVVDIRHPEGDKLCGDTMQIGTQPHILPAAPHNESCRGWEGREGKVREELAKVVVFHHEATEG